MSARALNEMSFGSRPQRQRPSFDSHFAVTSPKLPSNRTIVLQSLVAPKERLEHDECSSVSFMECMEVIAMATLGATTRQDVRYWKWKEEE